MFKMFRCAWGRIQIVLLLVSVTKSQATTHHQSQVLNVPTRLCASNYHSKPSPSPPPYIPHKLVTNTHVKMNASMCYYNPDVVAYLADNDLWVCDLVSCKEMRLTSTEYAKTGVMAGRPSFVMQEEFSRFNGFWWRPQDVKGVRLSVPALFLWNLIVLCR